MNIYNLVIILFVLSAFAIGVTFGENEGDLELMNNALDNASETIQNLELTVPSESQLPYIEGIYKIIEEYVQFVVTLYSEILRAGISFGYENPEYFSPEFILTLVKFIIILIIISLLIKPIFYFGIFIILGLIWVKDKINQRKNDRTRNTTN